MANIELWGCKSVAIYSNLKNYKAWDSRLLLTPEDSSYNLSSTVKLELYRKQWWNSPGPGLVYTGPLSLWAYVVVLFLVIKSTPETDTVEVAEAPQMNGTCIYK